MKKIFTLLLATSLAGTALAQTPTLVNGDFEGGFRTVTVTNFTANITTTIPNGWFCADSLAAGLSPFLALAGLNNLDIERQCFDTADAHTGTAAVGLKTINLSDSLQLPGMLSNAKMSIDIPTLMANPNNMQAALKYEGGTPMYKNKVDEVKAWIKLDTSNVAVGIAMVNLYAKDARDSSYNVIGGGIATILPDTGYQEVTVNIDYAAANFTAVDTMIITFISSLPDSVLDPAAPLNFMIVDDVSMTFSTGSTPPLGIKNINKAQATVTIAPNPIQNTLNIQISKFDKSKEQTLVVSDVLGRMITTVPVLVDRLSIDMSAYNSGIYQYQLFNYTDNTMEAGKFIKQ